MCAGHSGCGTSERPGDYHRYGVGELGSERAPVSGGLWTALAVPRQNHVLAPCFHCHGGDTGGNRLDLGHVAWPDPCGHRLLGQRGDHVLARWPAHCNTQERT